jgi:hypothetical protein
MTHITSTMPLLNLFYTDFVFFSKKKERRIEDDDGLSMSVRPQEQIDHCVPPPLWYS